MQSHADIIGEWPSVPEFAADLGIEASHARTLIVRKSIPPDYWDRVISAARRRGIIPELSPDLLLKLRPQRKSPAAKRGPTIPAKPAQSNGTQP